MHTPNLIRRTTAIALLAMAFLAAYAYGFVFPKMYVTTDPAQTLFTLTSSPFLLRTFLFSFVLVLILDVIVAGSFHLLLKESNAALSSLCALFRLVYVALLGASLMPLCGLLNVPLVLSQEIVIHSFQMFRQTWSLTLILFGCHLFLLGYLLLRSGLVAKWISALTLFAGLCYFATNALHLLFPGYSMYGELVDQILALPMALGELGIAIWFLVRRRKALPA